MLNPDYKDMLLCLNKHGVEFLLVGAYALAAHGYPRSTIDIDIWINPTKENGRRAFAAIAEFGAPMLNVSEESLSCPGVVYQIGVAPIRIDIITEISGGIDFHEAYDSGEDCHIDGIPLRIPSVQTLIRNKEATGRDKDILDAKNLRKSLS